MAAYIKRKVECLKHSLQMRNNRGRMDTRAFPINAAMARQWLLNKKDPICQRCGFECLKK